MSEVKSVSFKAFVPVKFYAKNPVNGKYSRVIQHQNLKKCQGFVVRNLNGTAKNIKNQEFVDFYKSFDRDYRNSPMVMSLYDEEKEREPIIYMITGQDADTAKQMAKPVGIAKGESKDKLGNTKSYEAKYAARNYTLNVKHFIKNTCRQLKAPDGQKLELRVFFNPKYNKKEELKGFEYVGAQFFANV